MQKSSEIYLEQFARLGVFCKVKQLISIEENDKTSSQTSSSSDSQLAVTSTSDSATEQQMDSASTGNFEFLYYQCPVIAMIYIINVFIAFRY